METDRLSALIGDLDNPDKPTLRKAVDQLIVVAAEAPQIRATLERRLNETGHRNYWPVAYVLGNLPQPSAAALRTLINTLNHHEPDIRWACALLMISIARREPGVIALLIELCRNGTANQKRMALYCLRDLALTDGDSLNAMLDSLSDSDVTVRVAAVTSLKTRAGERVRAALLNSYLNDEEIKVRNAAAVTLAQVGPPSAEFSAALQRAINSGEGQARKVATIALELLGKK